MDAKQQTRDLDSQNPPPTPLSPPPPPVHYQGTMHEEAYDRCALNGPVDAGDSGAQTRGRTHRSGRIEN